jgi:hypothetical protein
MAILATLGAPLGRPKQQSCVQIKRAELCAKRGLLELGPCSSTMPMAGTLIGTLKATVPSRDMGLITDIHPCAQIVSEWLSAMSYNAYLPGLHNTATPRHATPRHATPRQAPKTW